MFPLCLCVKLSRRWLARLGDADPVIGEGGVHAGEFDFGHVTARAAFCAHGTRRGAASLSLRFLRSRQMTRETLRVVIGRIPLQLLVRVVTREARDAGLVRVRSEERRIGKEGRSRWS